MEACEEDWEKNGEHCYLWNTDMKNWTAAEDFCQQAGGHLASVTSSSTNDYIHKGMNIRGFTYSYAWLGGNDIAEEGVWTWTDCTPWNNTFWRSPDPNNCCGGEDCMHMTGGKTWADKSCGSELGFVCSKKLCPGRIYEHFKK